MRRDMCRARPKVEQVETANVYENKLGQGISNKASGGWQSKYLAQE